VEDPPELTPLSLDRDPPLPPPSLSASPPNGAVFETVGGTPHSNPAPRALMVSFSETVGVLVPCHLGNPNLHGGFE